MERAQYNRHSRARMAETAKDASRHAAPDAPERIDHRRRCTRHDHRTCCRGSRGSASLPCHTLRKRVEMCHPAPPLILNATTSPLYARRYPRASSARWSLYARIAAPIPRLPCPTNDYFGSSGLKKAAPQPSQLVFDQLQSIVQTLTLRARSGVTPQSKYQT